MAVARSFSVVFEGEGHSHEPGIVPRAAKQLDVDRLTMIVESNRENHGGHAVGCAGCVTAAETGATTTSIVHADFAQQAGINDCVHAHAIGAGSIHPGLHNV